MIGAVGFAMLIAGTSPAVQYTVSDYLLCGYSIARHGPILVRIAQHPILNARTKRRCPTFLKVIKLG